MHARLLQRSDTVTLRRLLFDDVGDAAFSRTLLDCTMHSFRVTFVGWNARAGNDPVTTSKGGRWADAVGTFADSYFQNGAKMDERFVAPGADETVDPIHTFFPCPRTMQFDASVNHNGKRGPHKR